MPKSLMYNDTFPNPTSVPVDSLRYSAWECTLLCLHAGADCFVRNQHYETPLYLAALGGNGPILYTMLSFLINTSKSKISEADYLRIDEMCSDIKEFSPLHAAILSRSKYCIQLLLLAGCSPNKQNAYGSTAMHLAYRSNDSEIIAMIKDAGGKIDIKDNSGDVPTNYSPIALKERQKKKRKTSFRRNISRGGHKK